MAGRIFINYRRGDDPGNTGRLFDRLQEAFAPAQLFIDVDNIAPGLDFVRVLEEQVGQCDALLAVIGPRWLDATDPHGKRRLHNPDDFVRIEIEAALSQGKRVIPVLVGDAHMPRPDELPETMRPLARRNAVRLTHERFRADTQGLIKALQQALDEVAAARRAQEEAARQAEADAARREQVEEERAREEAAAHERARAQAEATEQGRRDKQQAPPRPVPAPRSVRRPSPVLWIGIALAAVGGIGWLAIAPASRAPAPSEPAPADKVFRDCADCPEMIAVPAGGFTMGSPASEVGRVNNEGPQHAVTFARQFAVGRFAVTFGEWDACASDGGCNGWKPPDEGWGRGRRPVINVSWTDAKAYVAWLSKKTGKPYRLLSEAEREYVTRAGTTTAYSWGDAIGTGNANCRGCGSQWDFKQTAPVGSFKPNGFGLYDVHGNVWEWVEDCYHNSYNGAPADGSVWTTGDCSRRVVRGGSWVIDPEFLRSAFRFIRNATDDRVIYLGFRVARTLTP